MASARELPNFGMPPTKRRPQVPVFFGKGDGKGGGKFGSKSGSGKQDLAPGELSAGERERRLKAGLPESALKASVPGQHPLAGAVDENGRPIYDINGRQLWKTGKPAESFAGPLLKPPTTSGGASSSTAKAAEAKDSEAGGDDEPKPVQLRTKDPAAVGGVKSRELESLDELLEKQGKAGFAGVYGFGTGTLEERSSAKKAIALRLEPLKEGVPEFERVLSEDNQNVIVGSKRGSVDFLIIDEAISKRHCEFALIGIHNELALAITDHSTNGTYVNGKRVPSKGKKYRIRNGDRVEVKAASLDESFGWICDFGNTVSFFTR